MIKPEERDLILESAPWSYSKVNSYATCPRMFRRTYLESRFKESNAFAEWGTFCHHLLEQYYLGNVEFFELSDMYERDYDKQVKTEFPPNAYVSLRDNYFKQGKKYFDFFEGQFPGSEILGVEERISIKVGKWNFTGFIDLVLKDEQGIYIVDHKSKRNFTNQKELNHYLMQLYLYSIYIEEKYGEYPYKLVFNMFRMGKVVEEKFDITKLNKAKEWFISTIEKVYKDTKYPRHCSDFFCDYICSVRQSCRRLLFWHHQALE